MFVTSRDLLNLVIAICAIWLTVFVCWSLYYTAMILKKVNDTLERITMTLTLMDQFFASAKAKVDAFGQTVSTVVKVASDLAGMVGHKKAPAKKTKSK